MVGLFSATRNPARPTPTQMVRGAAVTPGVQATNFTVPAPIFSASADDFPALAPVFRAPVPISPVLPSARPNFSEDFPALPATTQVAAPGFSNALISADSNAAPVEERKETIEDAISSLSLTGNESAIPIYTLFVSDDRVCFFVSSCMNIIEKTRAEIGLPTIDKGHIYHVSALTRDFIDGFRVPSELTLRKYTSRNSFVCDSKDAYRDVILPALLLGCRVRDYEQRCATVVQTGDLVLSMPAQGGTVNRLKLKTIAGASFDVDVKLLVTEDEGKKWKVTCKTTSSLPSDVRQGCLLEIVNGTSKQSPVTVALFPFQSCNKTEAKSIGNVTLLKCIYGPVSYRVESRVETTDHMIRMRQGGEMWLNAEQAEAVARYNSSSVPAFVIEAPPGSGKTLTAAAMAASYKGKGVQLFLSTANQPVRNMALALARLDIGSRSPMHLISSEFGDTEENSSPFSSLTLAKAQKWMDRKMEQFGKGSDEERKRLREELRAECGPVLNEPHDIYFATVDTILNRLSKPNKGGSHLEDDVKHLLETRVERIVIDEASQLTESALNVLVLVFPKAQIVLIGDCKQLSPFRFTTGSVVSQLAARPALDVAKDKRNLPVIHLNHVYRASPALIAHYSDVFYDGALVSCKPESQWNPLAVFRSTKRCLFWRVHKGRTQQCGTSKCNFGEIAALVEVVRALRYCGILEEHTMIVSYYEAQRKEVEKALPRYEALTVDTAQGREKPVVIVLSTRTSVPADAEEDFFNSAKRLNVAVSRHQEALIVLGHPSIASAPHWTKVLDPRYFHQFDDHVSGRHFSA